MTLLDERDIQEEEVEFGGGTFTVSKAPRPQRKGRLKDTASAIGKLIDGMKLTHGYISSPSKIVTQEYPENRETLKLADRSRARLVMPHNEEGYHDCTSCLICEKICPNASIDITASKGEVTKKKELDRYIWRLDTCTFCNLCVVACPFDAIEMTSEFENAVYDRRLLVYALNEYSGPHDKLIQKYEPEEREEMTEPCSRFGETPLDGKYWPRMKPLGSDYPPEADSILTASEIAEKSKALKALPEAGESSTEDTKEESS